MSIHAVENKASSSIAQFLSQSQAQQNAASGAATPSFAVSSSDSVTRSDFGSSDSIASGNTAAAANVSTATLAALNQMQTRSGGSGQAAQRTGRQDTGGQDEDDKPASALKANTDKLAISMQQYAMQMSQQLQNTRF